jgi:hypothetical protein
VLLSERDPLNFGKPVKQVLKAEHVSGRQNFNISVLQVYVTKSRKLEQKWPSGATLLT